MRHSSERTSMNQSAKSTRLPKTCIGSRERNHLSSIFGDIATLHLKGAGNRTRIGDDLQKVLERSAGFPLRTWMMMQGAAMLLSIKSTGLNALTRSQTERAKRSPVCAARGCRSVHCGHFDYGLSSEDIRSSSSSLVRVNEILEYVAGLQLAHPV